MWEKHVVASLRRLRSLRACSGFSTTPTMPMTSSTGRCSCQRSVAVGSTKTHCAGTRTKRSRSTASVGSIQSIPITCVASAIWGRRYTASEERSSTAQASTKFPMPSYCAAPPYLPEELGTTFGKHCVQIDDPWALLHRITGAPGERHPVRQAFWGPITYGERAFADGEEVPGPMGFVKPIKYRDQREVRLLWVVDDDGPLQPEMVDLPGMQQVCKRVA
jgi:hypothetical protein